MVENLLKRLENLKYCKNAMISDIIKDCCNIKVIIPQIIFSLTINNSDSCENFQHVKTAENISASHNVSTTDKQFNNCINLQEW